MALPVAPTPILRGKEARDFIEKIKKNENKPSYPVPTPKLKAGVEEMLALWAKK